VDTFFFTFFHEICHVLKHNKKDLYIDTGEISEDEKEREADNYARKILIPDDKWRNFLKEPAGVSLEKRIYTFSKQIGVGQGVVAGRYAKEFNKWKEVEKLRPTISDEDINTFFC
jgi:HTH-type transcriptional regulator/antitoxin HigA